MNSTLREELEHEKLIETLFPAYKLSGLGVEAMDKTINFIEALIQRKQLEARIDTALYFKKYMISTSPFIREIVNPYLEDLEAELSKELKEEK